MTIGNYFKGCVIEDEEDHKEVGAVIESYKDMTMHDFFVDLITATEREDPTTFAFDLLSEVKREPINQMFLLHDLYNATRV